MVYSDAKIFLKGLTMRENKLRTPEGVTDYLPKDYALKKEIESRIETVFYRYGYSFITSPTFEYSEVFGDSSDSAAIYKFIDRDGAVLALRPDLTPPIARIASTNYSYEDAPLRFCYVENAFRYNESYQGKLREFTQAGVELIGVSSDDADAEVIAVAINSLIAAGISDFRVDIGQVEFLKGVIEEASLTEDDNNVLMGHILNKDFAETEKFISSKQTPGGVKTILSDLSFYIGDIGILSGCRDLVTNNRALTAIRRLEDIYGILKGYGLEKYVSFDLSMLGMLDYYTGIIFRGYARGAGFSVIDGGRYDRLCGSFGKNFPAVGFAIRVNNLMPVFESQNIIIPAPAADTLVAYTEEGRDAALNAADELRSGGLFVENSLLGGDPEQNIAYAKKKNIGGLIYFKDNKRAELIDCVGGARRNISVAELLNAPNLISGRGVNDRAMKERGASS